MTNFIDDIPDEAGVRSISEMSLDCAPFLLESGSSVRIVDMPSALSFPGQTGDVR